MILLSMYVTIEVICLLIITKACGKHGMQIYKGGTDKYGQVRVEVLTLFVCEGLAGHLFLVRVHYKCLLLFSWRGLPVASTDVH